MQQYLKDLVKKFSKTWYRYPAGIAIASAVYYLVQMYAWSFCLSNIITPLVLLAIFWVFEVKSIKRLLIIGAVACLAFGGVWIAMSASYYDHVPTKPLASSEDGIVYDGTVTPFIGTTSTQFNFTVAVKASPTTPIGNVTLIYANIQFSGSLAHNNTMTLLERTNTSARYYYVTTLEHNVNQFIFNAEVNGTWHLAGQWIQTYFRPLPSVAIDGPTLKNPAGVALDMMLFGIYLAYANNYPIFAIILFLIWWTRRTRKMREDQLKRWESERTERESEQRKGKKDKAKVPSIQRAMGKEKDETFVCSECGADVPADATVCPKCGERFD